MDKKMQIDLFVSYSYRTGRNKEHRDDAAVGLMVQGGEGVVVPEGITRGMIEPLRQYLADAHQVKPNQVRLENIIRLQLEKVDGHLEDGQ